ncbi:MAG: hypothetical protein OEV92_13015 [Nitrospinota bacterium]|nr:hypothetical protein [Nitrospinota bacterium]
MDAQLIIDILGLFILLFALYHHKRISDELFGYTISGQGIEIKYYGFVAKKFRFDEIDQITIISAFETRPHIVSKIINAWHYENRISSEILLITAKSGLFKGVIISPEDINSFLKEYELKKSSYEKKFLAKC